MIFSKSVVSASDVCFTIYANNKTYNFYNEEIGYYNNEYYLKNASEIAHGIYLDTVVRAKDAYYILNDSETEKFTYFNEKYGSEIDKTALLNDINYALNNNQKSIKAKFVKTSPKVKKSDLINQTKLISKFATGCVNSPDNRKHNINLAISKINGMILKNGEEFSFNKIVGVRSLENGFKEAKIIINGEFSEGVGGGVCQVSTTLYNAVLLAGLTIVEQHPHSLQVSYIEPSFDAMVNSYSSDLKFVNNTGANVIITGSFNNESVIFKIYGVSSNVKYERVSVIKSDVICQEYVYEDDELLPFGATKIHRHPKNGINSEGFLIKYVNNERVSTKKIRCDTYNGVKGIVKVGKKLTS